MNHSAVTYSLARLEQVHQKMESLRERILSAVDPETPGTEQETILRQLCLELVEAWSELRKHPELELRHQLTQTEGELQTWKRCALHAYERLHVIYGMGTHTRLGKTNKAAAQSAGSFLQAYPLPEEPHDPPTAPKAQGA